MYHFHSNVAFTLLPSPLLGCGFTGMYRRQFAANWHDGFVARWFQVFYIAELQYQSMYFSMTFIIHLFVLFFGKMRCCYLSMATARGV
jgi:hypothetical protein